MSDCDVSGCSQALFSSLGLFFLFLFFNALCGSFPSWCDLLRFSELWSWLTGAFMHLVFPPFLPSGLLKSKFHQQLWSVWMCLWVFSFIVHGDSHTCSGCRADVFKDGTLCWPLFFMQILYFYLYFNRTNTVRAGNMLQCGCQSLTPVRFKPAPLGREEDKDR